MSGRVFRMTATLTVSHGRLCRRLLPAVAALLISCSGFAQSYVDEVQAEAQKLDGGLDGGLDETTDAVPETATGEGAQAAFERTLETGYRGSFLFYKKLPEKSRQEVFQEFQGGASIEEVRMTIMNRFLHTR